MPQTKTTPQQIDAWRAARSENEHLEFKAAKTGYEFTKLLKYCVAIANERGGVLLLGIENHKPRAVIGTNAFPNIEKTSADLLNKLRFRVYVEEVLHPNGRVLAFHIPSRPIGEARELDGAYYMRVGESLVPMTPDQLKKIHAEAIPRRIGLVILSLFAVFVIGVLSYKYWNLWHELVETHGTKDKVTAVVKHPDDPPVSKPLTIEELFKSDFSNLTKFSDVLTVASLKGDRKIQVPFTVYADFLGKSYFVGFLISPSDSYHTYEYCETLAWGWSKSFDAIVHNVSFEGSEFGQTTSLQDLTFSGRVFIYHRDILTVEQIVALRAVYRKKKLSVQFRGIDYVLGEAHRRNK